MKLSTEVRYEAVVYLLGNCVCGIGGIACGCSEVNIQKEDTVLAFATMAILALPVFQWFLALTKAVGAASAVGDNMSNPLKRTVGTTSSRFHIK